MALKAWRGAERLAAWAANPLVAKPVRTLGRILYPAGAPLEREARLQQRQGGRPPPKENKLDARVSACLATEIGFQYAAALKQLL